MGTRQAAYPDDLSSYIERTAFRVSGSFISGDGLDAYIASAHYMYMYVYVHACNMTYSCMALLTLFLLTGKLRRCHNLPRSHARHPSVVTLLALSLSTSGVWEIHSVYTYMCVYSQAMGNGVGADESGDEVRLEDGKHQSSIMGASFNFINSIVGAGIIGECGHVH